MTNPDFRCSWFSYAPSYLKTEEELAQEAQELREVTDGEVTTDYYIETDMGLEPWTHQMLRCRFGEIDSSGTRHNVCAREKLKAIGRMDPDVTCSQESKLVLGSTLPILSRSLNGKN